MDYSGFSEFELIWIPQDKLHLTVMYNPFLHTAGPI